MLLYEFVTRFEGENEYEEYWDKVTIDLEHVIAFNPSRTDKCTSLRTTSGELFTVKTCYEDVKKLMVGTSINLIASKLTNKFN